MMKAVIVNMPVCDLWKVPHFPAPLTDLVSLITEQLRGGHSLQAAVIIIQELVNSFHKLPSDS